MDWNLCVCVCMGGWYSDELLRWRIEQKTDFLGFKMAVLFPLSRVSLSLSLSCNQFCCRLGNCQQESLIKSHTAPSCPSLLRNPCFISLMINLSQPRARLDSGFNMKLGAFWQDTTIRVVLLELFTVKDPVLISYNLSTCTVKIYSENELLEYLCWSWFRTDHQQFGAPVSFMISVVMDLVLVMAWTLTLMLTDWFGQGWSQMT